MRNHNLKALVNEKPPSGGFFMGEIYDMCIMRTTPRMDEETI